MSFCGTQKLIMSSQNVIPGPKGRVMTFLTKAIQRWGNLPIGFAGRGSQSEGGRLKTKNGDGMGISGMIFGGNCQ